MDVYYLCVDDICYAVSLCMINSTTNYWLSVLVWYNRKGHTGCCRDDSIPCIRLQRNCRNDDPCVFIEYQVVYIIFSSTEDMHKGLFHLPPNTCSLLSETAFLYSNNMLFSPALLHHVYYDITIWNRLGACKPEQFLAPFFTHKLLKFSMCKPDSIL